MILEDETSETQVKSIVDTVRENINDIICMLYCIYNQHCLSHLLQQLDNLKQRLKR